MEGPQREFKSKWQKDRISRDSEGAGDQELKNGDGEKTETTEDIEKHHKKVFEKSPSLTWFNCHVTCQGDVPVGCRNPIVAFLAAGEGDVNKTLLKLYIQEMTEDGKSCRVVRALASTMDVVHPFYVAREQISGECSRMRQVIEENSVCLPIA